MKHFRILLVNIALLFCLVANKTYAQKQDSSAAKNSEDTVFVEPPPSPEFGFDEDPQPVGGYEAFRSFVKQNLIYPPEAIKAKASGVVYVSAIINDKGKIIYAKIKKDYVGYGCDVEALRLVYLSPNWQPGKTGGHAAKCRTTVPVKFVLP